MNNRLTREAAEHLLKTEPFNLNPATYGERRQDGRVEGCAVALRCVQLSGSTDAAMEKITKLREDVRHGRNTYSNVIEGFAAAFGDSPNYMAGLEDGLMNDGYRELKGPEYSAGFEDGVAIYELHTEMGGQS